MDKTLENLKEITGLLQGRYFSEETLTPICGKLKESLNANVLVCDYYGKILVKDLLSITEFFFNHKKNCDTLDSQFIQKLNLFSKSTENISVNSFCADQDTPNYRLVVLPMLFNFERTATMLVYRETEDFKVKELILIESAKAILTLLIGNIKAKEEAVIHSNVMTVRCVLGNLSYSELEAVVRIFNRLSTGEGLIVASKIAEEHNITKSVIVNAIRKLQSAGVLESRSLGMKGTYIKTLNPYLIREIKKL